MKIVDWLLEAIYPTICGFCGTICKESLCKKCEIELTKKIHAKRHIYLTRNITEHLYIFDYQEAIREKIISYKFQEEAYLAKTFVKILLKDKKVGVFLQKYDIIVPVPISNKRMRQRGYNQSELLLKEMAKIIPLVYQNKLLKKVKDTVAQSTLGKEERMRNLQDVYKVTNKEVINNKKILLFDDIFTTGSTAEECSKELKRAGAKEIRNTYNCKRLK